MNIELIETQALIDELRNRFKAFIFSGLVQDSADEEYSDASLYVYHGGTILSIGLCRLMERTLMSRRVEIGDEEL